MPGTVSAVFGIASMAFPPLAVLGPVVTAFEIALTAYKTWGDDIGAYEKTAEVLRKLSKYDAEFRERLALINDLLDKHDYDESELVMNKKHIMDSFMEFSEQVEKMADVVKKQQLRIKEHSTSTAKKAVAVVSGATKTLIADEKQKCRDIKGEADTVRGALLTKLEGFTTRLKASPTKGSSRALSASAAPPLLEETLAHYAAAMAEARDEESKAESRASSALKAARISSESMVMVSEALELCREIVVATKYDEERLEYFHLPEPAVSDLAAVVTTWGKKSSPIAEYAWGIVKECLDCDELENELPKWGRHQFLRLADVSLAHMIKPENKAAWTDSIDDLGRALARLVNSETMATEALTKFPSIAHSLLQVVHVHAKDPNVFLGALGALSSLFKKAEPEIAASLAALAVPWGQTQGAFPVALPLISIVRLCADNVSGKKGADKFHSEVAVGVLGFMNTVINTAGLRGLHWLGTTFLETENAASQQLYTETIKLCDALAKKYTMKMGDFNEEEEEEEEEEDEDEEEETDAEVFKCTTCDRQFKASSSLAQHQKATGHEAEEEEEEEEEEEVEEEEEEEEEEQKVDYPLEINVQKFDTDLAEQVALFLHFFTTGQDAELNPKRVLLPPAAVAKYWQVIADGNEDVFNLQLTLVTNAFRHFFPDTEPQDQRLTPETLCPVLKTLIYLVKENSLGKLEGEMAECIKEDPAFNLGWAVQQIIDSKEGADMTDVVKDAKQLKKLLDKGVGVSLRSVEKPAAFAPAAIAPAESSGGCCVIA